MKLFQAFALILLGLALVACTSGQNPFGPPAGGGGFGLGEYSVSVINKQFPDINLTAPLSPIPRFIRFRQGPEDPNGRHIGLSGTSTFPDGKVEIKGINTTLPLILEFAFADNQDQEAMINRVLEDFNGDDSQFDGYIARRVSDSVVEITLPAEGILGG